MAHPYSMTPATYTPGVIDDEQSSQTSEEPEKDSDSDDGAAKKKSSFIRELPVLVVVALVVALVVRTFAMQPFWIPSGSMENTLQRDDRILVNKLVYDFRQPERGEVMVFTAPIKWRSNAEDEDFIKRVIGVGGDTVSYDRDDRKISVNGYPIDESDYIYKDGSGTMDPPSRDNYEFSVTVPKDRLWVMGDHRGASGDSRENYIRSRGDILGSTIPVESVIGKAFVLMWPFDRFDWLSTPDCFAHVPEPKQEIAPALEVVFGPADPAARRSSAPRGVVEGLLGIQRRYARPPPPCDPLDWRPPCEERGPKTNLRAQEPVTWPNANSAAESGG